MIVEERIYTLYLGKVTEYTRLMKTEGIAIQEPTSVNCLATFPPSLVL